MFNPLLIRLKRSKVVAFLPLGQSLILLLGWLLAVLDFVISISPCTEASGAMAIALPLAMATYSDNEYPIQVHKSIQRRTTVSHQWFRAALESSFDAIYLLQTIRDKSGEITDFEFIDLNERGAQLISRRREEVLYQRLCELLPVNRTLGYFDKYKAVVETGVPLDEEFSTEGMPGVTARWLHHQVVPIDDGIAITSRDITERKQNELAIAAREAMYRTLAESMAQMVWQLNAKGEIEYANQCWQEGLGVTPEQINQEGWASILHPDDLTYLNPRWQRAFERGEPNEDEFRYRMADGSYRWFLGRVVPVKDERGQVMKWIGTSTDIDDRKRFEQELQQREQQFRTLAENSPDVIARVDRQFRHLYVNQAVTKATGLPPEAFIGKDNAEVGTPLELTQFFHSKLNQVLTTAKPLSYEFQFPSPDETRYYFSRVVPEFDSDGEVESLLGITSDITDVKLAEAALRQSETRFRRVVESNMVGIGFWNLEGQILYANDVLLKMIGYTREEVENCQLSWREITPREYDEIEHEALQEIAAHGFCNPFEKEYICKNGSRVPILCGAATFEGSNDSGVFFVVDLTERKQMELECERLLKLERAARQEAEAANRIKDEFLAVISHELRTPLNPILGWTKLLQSRKFDSDRVMQALSVIERNAKQQSQLVEDLLDVSQILQGKLRLSYCPVDVTKTVKGAIATVRLSAEAKAIQLHARCDRTPGRVLGHPDRIQQIVWNLLSNAIKFTPSEGRVEVSLKCAGGFAQIRVSDTGMGIEPAFLPCVFDYFRQSDTSTTRTFGGLGLGLAIARHLTELHGGTIEAASAGKGKGATFTVRLPLIQHDPYPGELEGDCEPLPCLDEALLGLKILVVDDEEDSREFVTVALRQAGAEVIATASVKEALQALNQHRPNVLISDIAMPDEDGYSLMQQLRLLEPDLFNSIPAIALTAFASDTDEHQTLAAGFQRHLSKPVAPEELIMTVAALAQVPPATNAT